MPEPTKRNPELEAAIEKDLDNLDAYRAYADWLRAQGDPRGELIALQCAAHGLPPEKARDLLEQADTLLNQHEDLLLGGLVGLKDKVRWRFGFIEGLRMSGTLSTRSGDELSQGKFLQLFMALPSARFLRRLDMVPVVIDLGDILIWPVSEELGMAVYPTLETLVLLMREDGTDPRESVLLLSRARFPKESFPRLRSLRICGTVDNYESLDLPELRELMMLGISPFLHQCEYAARARLPKLERLVLHGHPRALAVRADKDGDIHTLLEAQQLPRLKHLDMNWSSPFVDPASSVALCRVLARSPLLRQLESLNLSENQLEDECAKVLLEHAAAFKHLRHLDLSGNHLSARTQARVATLCASVNTRPGEKTGLAGWLRRLWPWSR